MFLLDINKEMSKGVFTLVSIFVLSISLSVHSLNDGSYKYGQTVEEQETLRWIWKKAQQFSGIQSKHHTESPYHLPVYIVTKSKMNKEMCPDEPQNCRKLVGAYDTGAKRILLHNDFVPEEDTISASFLLHEFIHALQNETISDEYMVGTCSCLRRMEQEAYDAQNAFLRAEGAFFRAGIGMRMMVCPDDM